MRGIDTRLDQAVAAYALATQHLDDLQAQIASGRRQLRLARYQLGVARQQLAEHLVVAYKSSDASLLDVVLETRTFDQLLTKIDYVHQIAGSDAGLVRDVQRRKTAVSQSLGGLKQRLGDAQRAAAALGERRDALRAELAQRRSLLSGLKADVVRLVSEARTVKAADPKPDKGPATTTATPVPVSGPWRSLIAAAAAANGISADGLYRLMLAESGGSAAAVNGPYCGLYQYARGTWTGSWNPWRGADIFDGAAQIKATALAIKLGYGSAWWPTTYPWAFGGG
ncbi:MAG TPA: hypothetical protein VK576_10475 [Thermoleophilia bacterium]|nr:hypothetical protein [Thermoleophilia bacterium]